MNGKIPVLGIKSFYLKTQPDSETNNKSVEPRDTQPRTDWDEKDQEANSVSPNHLSSKKPLTTSEVTNKCS